MFIKFDFFFFYPYVTYLHFKCLKHLQTWNQKIMYANANHDIQKCPMIKKKKSIKNVTHDTLGMKMQQLVFSKQTVLSLRLPLQMKRKTVRFSGFFTYSECYNGKNAT